MPTPVNIPPGQMADLRNLFNEIGGGYGNRGYQPGGGGSGVVNIGGNDFTRIRKSVGGQSFNERGGYVGSTDTSNYMERSAAGKAGIVWSKLPEDAFEELAIAYEKAIKAEVRTKMKAWSKAARQYMVDNAPWGDRSGAARSGLGSQVGGNQYGSWLVLFHTVPYGSYLEGINPKTQQPMLNAGQYSIIEPTVDMFSKRIWDDIEQMLRS